MGRGRGAPGGRTPARGAGGGGRRRAAAPDASVRAPPPPHPHPRRRAPGGAASFPPQRAVEPEPGRAELWMRRSGCSAGHREGGVVVGGGRGGREKGGRGREHPERRRRVSPGSASARAHARTAPHVAAARAHVASPRPAVGGARGGRNPPLPPPRVSRGSTAPGGHGEIPRGKAAEALWSASPREVPDPMGWALSCGVCVAPEGSWGILAL